MKLNNSNYFSKQASRDYFSVSQIKAFYDCEARAMAEIEGTYVPEQTTALMVGSYVDAYFSDELLDFCNEHKEIFKKDGELKADYRKAEDVIIRIESDPLFNSFMKGEKQVIKTGELFGHPFKIKMDSYFPGEKIVDLKVMRSLDRIMGRSLVEYWNYTLQAAVYQAIEGNHLPFYLAIATKETVPNIEIVQVEQYAMDEELEKLGERIQRFADIKAGKIKPERCGVCDYCKKTKVLTKPISAEMLGYSNKELKATYLTKEEFV